MKARRWPHISGGWGPSLPPSRSASWRTPSASTNTWVLYRGGRLLRGWTSLKLRLVQKFIRKFQRNGNSLRSCVLLRVSSLFMSACMCLPGENVVPEPEDEAEAGGPRSALRVPVRPGGPAAACAVSAPLPGWTALGTQGRLLPAAAAAVRRGPAGRFAPRRHPSAPLLSPVSLPN